MTTPHPAPYPSFDGSQTCAQVDWFIFFPEKGGTNADAKKMCASCPWLDECRNYAIWHQVVGIWGGTSAREREKERTKRKIKPLPVTASVASIREEIEAADPAIPYGDLARQLGCTGRTVLRHRAAMRSEEAA